MSNNLDIDQVAAAQNQKEVTINDGNGQLDAALTDAVTISVTSTNAYTLTNNELRRFQFITVDEDGGDPAVGAITVTAPAIKRGLFVVLNETAFTVTVEITGQAETSPVVAAGERVVLSSDGVNVRAAGVGDHGALTGLTDDDHVQYLLVDGTRAMTGALDMGTNNITNVGAVDGVDVSAHVAGSTIHFTEASIDHGSIAGLADDDHTQYLLVNGTRAMTGDLNLGSQDINAVLTIKNANGTAPLPSYTFTLDPDTGVFNSATNAVGITTGGVNRLDVTATGRVLISPVTVSGLTTDGFLKVPVGGSTLGAFVTDTGSGSDRLHWRLTFSDTVIAAIGTNGTSGTIFISDGSIKRFNIDNDGTLTVGSTANYETLVTADDDIPNKKYVDDEIGQDLGEFTVAGLPTASSFANYWALATDASGGRTIVRSDGTNWKVVAVEGATVST